MITIYILLLTNALVSSWKNVHETYMLCNGIIVIHSDTRWL